VPASPLEVRQKPGVRKAVDGKGINYSDSHSASNGSRCAYSDSRCAYSDSCCAYRGSPFWFIVLWQAAAQGRCSSAHTCSPLRSWGSACEAWSSR